MDKKQAQRSEVTVWGPQPNKKRPSLLPAYSSWQLSICWSDLWGYSLGYLWSCWSMHSLLLGRTKNFHREETVSVQASQRPAFSFNKFINLIQCWRHYCLRHGLLAEKVHACILVWAFTCAYVFLLARCIRSHLCRTVFCCKRWFLPVWLRTVYHKK